MYDVAEPVITCGTKKAYVFQMMEAAVLFSILTADFSEILVSVCQNARCHMPRGQSLVNQVMRPEIFRYTH